MGVLFCACSSVPGFQSAAPFAGSILRHQSSAKISHVVVIVQENRSFNNLFYGFPGAKTQSYGYDSHGKRIALRPVSLDTIWDLDHSSYSFFAACNGKGTYPGTGCRMNGFDKEAWYCGGQSEPPCPIEYPPYAYVPHDEIKPYFFLGEHYVLADQMYASNFDASSFISHQYIIAAQASAAVNYPWNWWGCEDGSGSGNQIATVTQQRQYGPSIDMCWDNPTLGDELDAAGLSWAYYAVVVQGDGGYWSAYQNIKHIYEGPDWKKDVISPPTRFFDDVAKGKLRAVTWITPTCENSDHAGCGSKTGPSWVASLVNAIGKSKYWNSTAIFIFWDDYGGWYDPVPPRRVDYDGLGFRIPLLIVSAYAKRGYVDDTHYEHGSILRWIENNFGLGQLSKSDARAMPPDAAFDFNAPPRKFGAIPSEYGIDYFKHQPRDERIPDSE